MNCIIIEDQLPAQRILKRYIDDIGSLHLVGTYTDALEAVPVLKTEEIDVIFLDIHLPKLSGMDLLKTLPHPPQIILTTAFQDYALESYEYSVTDYLLKPFSFQRFVKAISKAEMQRSRADPVNPPVSSATVENATENNPDEIYIKSGYDHIRIKTDEIIFIMSVSDYTKLHLKEKKHLSPEPLRYWEEFLSSKIFMRIHKSYIINTTKIIKVSGNRVFLENDQVVPIGRAYKNDFTKRLID